MARLIPVVRSDGELPDPSVALQCVKPASPKIRTGYGQTTFSNAKESLDPQAKAFITVDLNINSKIHQEAPRQRSLGLKKLGQSLPSYKKGVITIGKQDKDDEKENTCVELRRSPRKPAKSPIAYAQNLVTSTETSLIRSESSFDEAFRQSDSESSPDSLRNRLSEFRLPRSLNKGKRLSPRKGEVDLLPRQLFPHVPRLPLSFGPPSSQGLSQDKTLPRGSELESSSSDQCEQPASVLRFSPPPSYSPHKYQPSDRPVTPPTSPTKPRLQSPTKLKSKVPPPPHRPSIDAFWSAEVTNKWHDIHSPRKPKLTSSGLQYTIKESEESDLSPIASPRKSPVKSPLKSPFKKSKTDVQLKKEFETSKHGIAENFLRELDDRIAFGKISSLTTATGGIKIIWSNKLNSTAGRANWKREIIRPSLSSKSSFTSSSSCQDHTASSSSNIVDLTCAPPHKSTQTPTIYRHHATIELATKVIATPHQLLNVLTHEFCHLCTFMLSNIKNNPHGKEFKCWASKASTLFAERGVEVTTKHSFEIEYRYIWLCAGRDGDESGCGLEYKRHSKSIDPTRQGCGKCRGRLVQVKPIPRTIDGDDKGRRGGGRGGEYRIFVKANYARVKAENPEMGMGEVMREVARIFREVNAGREKEKKDTKVVMSVSEEKDASRDVLLDDIERRMVDLTV